MLEKKDVRKTAIESPEIVKLASPESMRIGNPNSESLTTRNDGSNPRERYQHTSTEKTKHMVKEDAAVNRLSCRAESRETVTNIGIIARTPATAHQKRGDISAATGNHEGYY